MSKVVAMGGAAVLFAFGTPTVVARLVDPPPTIAPAGDGEESTGEQEPSERPSVCFQAPNPSPRGTSMAVTSEAGEPPVIATGTLGDLPWMLEVQAPEPEDDVGDEEDEDDPAAGEENIPPGEMELVLRFDPDTYGAASMPANRGDDELVYSQWGLRDDSGVYMFGAVTSSAAEVRAEVVGNGTTIAELFQVSDNPDQGINDTEFFVLFLPRDSRGSLIVSDETGQVIARDDFDRPPEGPGSVFTIEGIEPCGSDDTHDGSSNGDDNEG